MMLHAPHPYTLRPLQAQDLDDVAHIENLSSPSPWSRAAFARQLETEWATNLGLFNGRCVGFLVFWVTCGECQLLNIALAPEARGRGLGRFLMRTLFNKARQQEATSVLLEVRPNNTPAVGLYRSLDFTRIGLRKQYYDSGDDALVMSRPLASS